MNNYYVNLIYDRFCTYTAHYYYTMIYELYHVGIYTNKYYKN